MTKIQITKCFEFNTLEFRNCLEFRYSDLEFYAV